MTEPAESEPVEETKPIETEPVEESEPIGEPEPGFPEIPLAVAQETAWPSQRLTSTYSEHSGKRQSKG